MNIKSASHGAKGNLAPFASVSASRTVNVRRKLFVGLAASLALAAALPASATNWWNATPSISIGSAAINVKNMGAMGNGSHNDTAAIQAAINALPSTGGTIVIPAGTYMIDASKGISLRSHVRLELNSAATLKAIPNDLQRYWVVKVWNVNNVEIEGGTVMGERNAHRGSGGEWGYGINISGGSKIYVHNITVSQSWGDGVLVGATGSGSKIDVATGVTLNHVTSTGNRRQGLTICPSTQVYVVNSTFTNTSGTAPQAGIDIEPATQGKVNQVRLESTTLSNNTGNGLEVHTNVNGLTLYKVTSKNNKGFGVYALGATNIGISGSTLTENYLFGVDVAAGNNYVSITGNTINYNGDAWFYAHNKSIFSPSATPRDITISGSAQHVTQSSNIVSPK